VRQSERLHKLGEVAGSGVEDPGMRAAAWEDYRACPRKVLLPDLRGITEGAGALAFRSPRWFWAGTELLAMVLVNSSAASAVEPSEQDYGPSKDRDRCLNLGGSGRSRTAVGGAALDPIIEAHPDPCHDARTQATTL